MSTVTSTPLPQTSAPLLEVKNLTKYFSIQGGIFSTEVDRLHAVDGVSFSIAAGETLGMVGESGCGKSTTGRCILRLIEPSSGDVMFEGQSVTQMDKHALREVRRDMQIIFQDPFASLNPRMTVQAIIGEALTIHKLTNAPLKHHKRQLLQLQEQMGRWTRQDGQRWNLID